ncbi:MAG TPA: AMP-binding protein, partial [Candidatus Bathyarchaeia archaeon]|nr:AMP-binding protein [Candidatus Bathyarchaeia archaeon]
MPMEEKPWFRFWPSDVPKNIEYPVVPLNEILKKTAKEHPEKTAMSYFEGKITFGELDALSDQFAAALAKLGVKKGDRVAIFLPNIPQFVIAYFGILKAGAVLTAISPLHKEREVEYQLSDSEAETIIALDSLYAIVANIWQKTTLKNAIVTSIGEYAPKTAISTSEAEQKSNVHSFQELLNENVDAKPPKVNINPQEDLAALQYTGGTTGTAKGAMLTHMNLVSNTIMFAAWIKGATAKETFLTALPLFHIYGMTTSMNVPIHLAAKMVMLPRFEPLTALESIQRHRVTVFCGVPTMYALLLANPELGKFDL